MIGEPCPECEAGESPWWDDGAGVWVHSQDDGKGLIVTCNRPPPDPRYQPPLSPRPCLGCGYCCSKARCYIGALTHGPGEGCPSLVEKDGRFWCGMILEADEEQAAWLRKELYVGAGCCSGLNSLRALKALGLDSTSP